MAEQQWQGTTYGNTWMHQRLIRLLRYIDIRFLYVFATVFVVPVCLVVNPARRIIYRYFRLRWHMSPLKASYATWRNFVLFSQVVIDKFAMYAGKTFNVEIEGYHHYQRLVSQPASFLQLSAHIGNYEVAGFTLRADKKKINALVYLGEKESVMENRKKLFTQTNIRMIGIREDMGHLFEINEALSNGEAVSMPADRLFGSKKSISKLFLGAQAAFPSGPFSFATMRGLDCIAVNVMKTNSTTYKIYVTPLEYDKTLPRKEQIEQLASAYTAELERMLAMYPEQWYNYFEFWT